MLVLVALKTQPVSYSSLNFSLNSLNKTCLALLSKKKNMFSSFSQPKKKRKKNKKNKGKKNVFGSNVEFSF